MKIIISDTFSIKGRGQIVIINKLDSPNVGDVKIGNEIIQGKFKATITSIERYQKSLWPPIPGNNYGFCLKGNLLNKGKAEIELTAATATDALNTE